MRLITIVLLGMFCLFLYCGCSKNKMNYNKTFLPAIEKYLNENSYDIKPSSITHSDIKSTSAIITCKLREKDSTYGLSVTWIFFLKKEKGKWAVTRHEQK